MANSKNLKLKILYLLDILRIYSDEDHPINASEICEHLRAYGIDAERKSIYNDIENLRLKGYDIIVTKTPRPGFFLAERELELPQIRLLIDAIQSAGFITRKKSLELTDKLKQFVSKYQAVALNSQIYIDKRKKAANEEIYYTIDAIHRAILAGRKIELKYDRTVFGEGAPKLNEKTFVLSPYALLWSGDRYYVVANNQKYDDLMHLRVDRIKKITILDEECRPFCEVSEYKDFFDVADYAGKIFNAFGGETKTVTLRCKNEAIDSVTDLFGSRLMLRPGPQGSFIFSAEAAVSKGFIQSILQLGPSVEVLSPEDLRRQISDTVSELYNIYNNPSD